ncbi:hypothetical protein [Sphingomonas sp. PB2P12]|uniref:hypothetical protein n=1 Tax=Sphingomonas sandaracina TaxID=3096157 RepID=UPI002FC8E114
MTTLIDRLDSKSCSQQEDAWIAIRSRGVVLIPEFKSAYARFKKSEGRAALVFYATSFARVSEDAFDLGRFALKDPSKLVRDRACGLLAYSLRADAVGPLTETVNDPALSVRQSAEAALLAIRTKNHHLFVDPTRSGKIFWVVNPQDKLQA